MGPRTALFYPWMRWFGVLRAFSIFVLAHVLVLVFCREGRGGWVATHLKRPTPRDPPRPSATHPDPARQLSSPRNRTGLDWITDQTRSDQTETGPDRTGYRNWTRPEQELDRTRTGPEPEPNGNWTGLDRTVQSTVQSKQYFNIRSEPMIKLNFSNANNMIFSKD